MITLHHDEAHHFLRVQKDAQMVFMDPPDNLGLDYAGVCDRRPKELYYSWLTSCILESLRIAPVVWISYYWAHDLEIKAQVHHLLKTRYPLHDAKTFIWAYSFGQHSKSDCASGYRPILRLSRRDHVWNTGNIMVQSERQRLGDKRANPDGRVPDDFWLFDFPRVAGTFAERRPWHPTQHPEGILNRIIQLSTKPGDLVIDPFAGTGTTMRCCRTLDRNCTSCELSPTYCKLICTELSLPETSFIEMNP